MYLAQHPELSYLSSFHACAGVQTIWILGTLCAARFFRATSDEEMELMIMADCRAGRARLDTGMSSHRKHAESFSFQYTYVAVVERAWPSFYFIGTQAGHCSRLCLTCKNHR